MVLSMVSTSIGKMLLDSKSCRSSCQGYILFRTRNVFKEDVCNDGRGHVYVLYACIRSMSL